MKGRAVYAVVSNPDKAHIPKEAVTKTRLGSDSKRNEPVLKMLVDARPDLTETITTKLSQVLRAQSAMKKTKKTSKQV